MKKTFEVSDKLFELYHRVHRLVNESMTEEGVSLARSKFLFFLSKLGPCRSTDIACALNFAPRTVTEAIDGLERDRLVMRKPDPEDRRAKIVSITETGRAVLQAAEHPRKQLIEEIFSALDDEQLDNSMTSSANSSRKPTTSASARKKRKPPRLPSRARSRCF